MTTTIAQTNSSRVRHSQLIVDAPRAETAPSLVPQPVLVEARAPIADTPPVAHRAPGSSAVSSPLMVARCGTMAIPKAEVGPVERAHPEGVYDVTTRGERGVDTGRAGNKLRFESNALVIRDKVTGFGAHEVLDNHRDVGDLRRSFVERGDVAPFPSVNPNAPDWGIKRAFTPAGGWGALVSVAALDYAYDGGGKGHSRAELATFHYETGRRISLNDVLTPEDKNTVVMQLMAQLKQSAELSASYTSGKDPKQLIDEAMNNFAMFQGDDGKAKLTVAILSGCHATDGTYLQATMDAPRSLRHAAGLG